MEESKILDPELIQIDETDVKAFKNIRESLSSSYEKLGMFKLRQEEIAEQFEVEEGKIKEQIKAAKEKFNNFLDMMSDRYSFNPDVTWRFNDEKECFEATEKERSNK